MTSRKPYSLRLYQPPLVGLRQIEDFTEVATQVSATHRRVGGNWLLEFTIPLNSERGRIARRNQIAYLNNWYENRLGFRVDQQVRGTGAFRGIVWEMELALNGSVYRKSLGDVYNYVKVTYNGGVETGWQTDNNSRNRYGRREIKINREQLNSGEAANAANVKVREWSQPVSKPLGFNEPDDYLRVTVAGLVWTLQSLFADNGADAATTVSAYINDLAQDHIDEHAAYSTTGNGYFLIGRIETNSTATVERDLKNYTYYKTIKELAEIGNASDTTTDLFTFGIDGNSIFSYRIASSTPTYEYRGREEGFVTVLGSQNPWLMRPGVVRDKTRSGRPALGASFLEQTNDSWVEEVTMSDGQAFPTFSRPDVIDDNDFARAQQRNLAYIERLENERSEG